MERDRGITEFITAGRKEMIRFTYLYNPLFALCCLIFLGCNAISGKKDMITLDRQETDTTRIITKADSIKTVGSEVEDTLKQSKALSPAQKLLINACNNYMALNPASMKIPEVMILKASVLYNNKNYDESRKEYLKIIEKYPGTKEGTQAIRMVAQSYYEESDFNKAQEWYRKLKEVAVQGDDKSEAVTRIAESIFRFAENLEKEKKFKEAASQYERIALEIPEAVIADISLYNAGFAYEKIKDWPRAILVYQRLKNQYRESKLVPKSIFRTAKCYEKMVKWDEAAETYLRLVANFPGDTLTPTSLFNAGFCFERNKKYVEAAMTFEKLAMSFPRLNDAADVLFKAGELYGKIKDWRSVTRVNKEFSRRFGNDEDRKIQAECMVGIALYMQNNKNEAIQQLRKAIKTYTSLKNPSTSNKYYAAKAQFTIGDIYNEYQTGVILFQPVNTYKRLLKQKSSYLEKTVTEYNKVLQYEITEWTTRSIFQIGQSYEDFAIGIFQQERPDNLSAEKSLALELGIAEAVYEYMINNAIHYHEQNVKLGIDKKIENEYILNSKKKLTYLTYLVGEVYIDIVDIARKLEVNRKNNNLAMIGQKLELLQKIVPFKERSFLLFFKCLELGSMYQIDDEFYNESKKQITKTAYSIAQVYSEVVDIARSAPIPDQFDDYEKFVFKTKLLKQIEGYEENALTHYLKTVKIAVAYDLSDEYVEKAKYQISKLLFIKGRCYDLLCLSVFDKPPYPSNINEAEKEEYRAQFEEIALTYQDQAFEIYKVIIDYANQNYATGKYLNHAYARLYQNYPEEYGVKSEKIVMKHISSGPKWKCSADSSVLWYSLEFDDRNWEKASKHIIKKELGITGFPGNLPQSMWIKNDDQSKSPAKAFFRRTFYSNEPPYSANLYMTAIDHFDVYFNDEKLVLNRDSTYHWKRAQSWDVMNKIRSGKNVLAVKVSNKNSIDFGLFPVLSLKTEVSDYLPRFPNTKEILDKKRISEEFYTFPFIKNFSIKQ